MSSAENLAIRTLLIAATVELLEVRAKLGSVRSLTARAYRLAPESGLAHHDDKTFAALELATQTVDELVAAYDFWLSLQIEGLRCAVQTTVEHRSTGPLVEQDFAGLLDEDGNPPIL